MELGEAVGMLGTMTQNTRENYCEAEESDRSDWKCCISGLAGPEPAPSRLLRRMKNRQGVKGYERPVPDKSKLKKRRAKWDIESCSREHFPFQTHHLIPKKHLPTHIVCTFLAKSYDKHPKYQLEKDSNYDTDHANNGYNMPFISTTAQWAEAGDDPEKQALAAYDLMFLTGIQLHQGSHSYEDFGEEDEDAGMETEGYLTATDKFLKQVFNAAQRHVKCCAICKKAKGKPDNIRPVESVVRHVDQVSLILLLKLRAKHIFVSERAFQYLATKA
jgi:hypothetical protein